MIDGAEQWCSAILHLLSWHSVHSPHLGNRKCKIGAGGHGVERAGKIGAGGQGCAGA
ncbi:hypothetical protein AB0C15_08105 [Micromonospora sp. NPDC048835]|uniref:hypothetical protein n=1 Tax=Micromonospora sp. NPDC048835 TaxID=3155147 RepID=UPI0033EFF2E4